MAKVLWQLLLYLSSHRARRPDAIWQRQSAGARVRARQRSPARGRPQAAGGYSRRLQILKHAGANMRPRASRAASPMYCPSATLPAGHASDAARKSPFSGRVRCCCPVPHGSSAVQSRRRTGPGLHDAHASASRRKPVEDPCGLRSATLPLELF